MNAELERLRSEILTRYGSIHAFCRQHEILKRSTVYAVLSGSFRGEAREQMLRIREALNGPGPQAEKPTAEEIESVLQQTKCHGCRPVNRRKCQRCRERTEQEARAVFGYLNGLEAACRDH